MERYRESYSSWPFRTSTALLKSHLEAAVNLFELTRAFIDIDSVTPNEEEVGVYLAEYLGQLAARTGGRVERIEVEPHRYNVLALWDDPVVTLSTHMDTVPPFFASRD